MAAVRALPAQYAKFLTSVAGLFVVYVQSYGLHWSTVPAITGIAAALGVYGVPNAAKPPGVVKAPPVPLQPGGQV